jgi:enamine deaminase RidA (YjgF/YER057c/UK114 family)
MSTKTPVLTDKAPKPLPGIYSQAIIANGVVYCSGAVGMDPESGKLVEGDVKARTVRTSPRTLFFFFFSG